MDDDAVVVVVVDDDEVVVAVALDVVVDAEVGEDEVTPAVPSRNDNKSSGSISPN